MHQVAQCQDLVDKLLMEALYLGTIIHECLARVNSMQCMGNKIYRLGHKPARKILDHDFFIVHMNHEFQFLGSIGISRENDF